jgi:hypothetical protein
MKTATTALPASLTRDLARIRPIIMPHPHVKNDRDPPAKRRAALLEDIDKPKQAILSQLECCVCMQQMSAPLNQCEHGHLYSTCCSAKLKHKCPQCRVSLPAVPFRNLAFEQVCASVEVSCRHAEQVGRRLVGQGEPRA